MRFYIMYCVLTNLNNVWVQNYLAPNFNPSLPTHLFLHQLKLLVEGMSQKLHFPEGMSLSWESAPFNLRSFLPRT